MDESEVVMDAALAGECGLSLALGLHAAMSTQPQTPPLSMQETLNSDIEGF